MEYKFLKAVIEGGVETRPDNVLIYATSNRRHLIKETWADRSDMEHDGDIHRSDTLEEKLSLASRFGLTIHYATPTRGEFLSIVSGLAQRQGLQVDPDRLVFAANQWESATADSPGAPPNSLSTTWQARWVCLRRNRHAELGSHLSRGPCAAARGAQNRFNLRPEPARRRAAVPQNREFTDHRQLQAPGRPTTKSASSPNPSARRAFWPARAGNHAQGVALAATSMGIKSTVCMPDGAPISKVEATKALGAEVCLVRGTYDDAQAKALELQKTTGATFIHPFDDEAVIAGQGTIGLEILEQLPDVEAVIVPIGGGGLISGVAFAVKSLHAPGQGLRRPGRAGRWDAGKPQGGLHPVTLAASNTFADGIAVKHPGDYDLPDLPADMWTTSSP